MGAGPTFPASIDADRILAAGREERPTFLGVGMPKCGTTWVHAILKAHPEIGMPTKPVGPPAKEFNFWSDAGSGIDTDAYLSAFRMQRRDRVAETNDDFHAGQALMDAFQIDAPIFPACRC